MKYANEHFSPEQVAAFVRRDERDEGGNRADGGVGIPPSERLAMSDHAATCAECRALIVAATAGDPYLSEMRVFGGLLGAAREIEPPEAEEWQDELLLPARTPEELADLRAFEKQAAAFEPESFVPGGTLGKPEPTGRGVSTPEGITIGTSGWWQRWTTWQWTGLTAGLAAVAIVAAIALVSHGRSIVWSGSIARIGDRAGISDGPLRVSADGKLEGAASLPVDLQNAVLETIRRGAAPGAFLGKVTRGGPVHSAPINDGPELSPFLPAEFPVGTTVESDRPTLRWKGAVADAHIEVVIRPGAGGDPIYSGPLPGMQEEWTVPQPLPRGQFYRWRAKIGPAAAGESPAGAMFKVLAAEAHERLEALRRGLAGQSHLTLGVAYAREGMREAAREEFQQLQSENGRSPLARQLLDSLAAW